VIIMTSNLGTQDLKRKAIGFSTDSDAASYEKIKERVTEALKKQFRPEFLNRIDEVIVFHELTMDEVKAIVDLMIVRIREQLKSQAVELVLSDDAKALLAGQGYDPQLGARPLRRAIQRMLEDPLSEKMLFGEFPAGSTVLVDIDPEELGRLAFTSVDSTIESPVSH
jgi:ATP-dependent Clp protease ATP-binding subunit ClpC